MKCLQPLHQCISSLKIYLTSLLVQNLGEVAKADHRLASSSPVSVTGSSAIVYHKVSACRKWEKKQHSLRIRFMFLLPCKTIGRCCGTHLIPCARIKEGMCPMWQITVLDVDIPLFFLNIKNQSDWKHIHQEGLQQVSKAILKAAFNNKSTWHKSIQQLPLLASVLVSALTVAVVGWGRMPLYDELCQGSDEVCAQHLH